MEVKAIAEAPAEGVFYLVLPPKRMRDLPEALTGIVPRQELGEEGMVVCQGLAGSCRISRSLAGGREVRELGRGLRMLVLDALGNGACKKQELSARVIVQTRRG